MREPELRRVLPLVGPSALTAVFVVLDLLRTPPATVLAATAAMVAAWITFGLWAFRRAAASPLHTQMMAEQEALMAELREFVGREVFGAHGELDRSRRLIREAVEQLNASFRSMAEQSRRQRTMITCLVDDDGAGSAGVRQFADSMATLIETLTRRLEDDSRESLPTARLIDETAQQVEEVFEVLGELKGIADQGAKLARDAISPTISDARSALRVFAFEMRSLTSRSTSLYERIHSLTGSSKVVVDRVRKRIEESAERGTKVVAQARAKADEVLNQVIAINRSMAWSVNLLSESESQIRTDVAHAVRSLQFEDIANQAMTAASVHIDRLRAINQDAVQLQQVLATTHESVSARALALESFGRLLRAKRDQWHKHAHKPVSQVNLRAGSVELF